jgi:hypothetical protein
MLRLGISVAALTLLGMGAASADMIAGTFFCTGSRHELVWQGAAPASIFNQGSRCGSATLSCTQGQANSFLNLVLDKKCEATESDDGVVFVCTGKSNQLTKHIDDLCKEVIP